MNKFKQNARYLRKNMTVQERKFWNIIRNKQFYGYRFLRQYTIDNYIVDFICCEKSIVVEIDGGQHNESQNITYDNQRTNYIKNKGYKIIRFWNSDIDNNIEGVYQKLEEVFGIANPS